MVHPLPLVRGQHKAVGRYNSIKIINFPFYCVSTEMGTGGASPHCCREGRAERMPCPSHPCPAMGALSLRGFVWHRPEPVGFLPPPPQCCHKASPAIPAARETERKIPV
uniref:Uncharacterized protein n=1 Tax=Cyanoderma ruficeps TaxID=181631 RepID=A0A8C3QXV1_9PASS